MSTPKQIAKLKNDESIQNFLKIFRHKQISATVTRVSKSGMTRWLQFLAVDEGGIRDITYYVAKLTNHTYKNEHGWGLKVGGCGMDMIYHILTCLNYAVAALDDVKLSGMGGVENSYSNYFTNADNYKRY